MDLKKATFLLAMPSLEDGIFTKSLILMTQHDQAGSLGFIINHPTGAQIDEALKLMQIKASDIPKIPILLGGPVQTDFFWAIHAPDDQLESTIIKAPLFHISGAMEVFSLIGKPEAPQIYFCGVGYAGWGEQQLEREIEEGAWWKEELPWDTIIHTKAEEKWHQAFHEMGIETEDMIDKTDPFSPPTIN